MESVVTNKEASFDSEKFVEFIQYNLALCDEGMIYATENKLEFVSMDPSQIAMVVCSMDAKASEFSAGLNIASVSKLLKVIKPSGPAFLSVKEVPEKGEVAFLSIGGSKCKLPLLELRDYRPKTPKIPFDSIVELNAGDLLDAFHRAEAVSTHAFLTVLKNGLKVEAEKDSEEIETIVKSKHNQIEGENIRSLYILEILIDMLKVIPKKATIFIGMKKDSPIEISFKGAGVSVTYYLAARVETN